MKLTASVSGSPRPAAKPRILGKVNGAAHDEVDGINMAPPRPVAPVPIWNRIPKALRESGSWLVWRYELTTNSRGEKRWTKVPYAAHGGHAKTNDPDTWTSFAEARRAFERGGFDGVGVVLIDDLVGVDLDHVINADGNVSDWAGEVLDRIGRGYVEKSPSGTGVHVIGRGKAGRCGKGGPRKDGQHQIEVYDESSPRFLTVSGAGGGEVVDIQAALDWLHDRHMRKEKPATAGTSPPASTPALSDAEVLRRARAASNGEKFRGLFDGRITSGDESSDDAALAALLTFWTTDPTQIERLMRRSALVREKWDRRPDYLSRTIGHALEVGGEHYRPPQRQRAASVMDGEVVLQRADEVHMRPVAWLWRWWLPRAKLTILAGSPEAGKTTLAMSIAATLTNGGRFPDGSEAHLGHVLIWSAEDDIEDTLAPRLAAAGADLSRAHFVRSVNSDGKDRMFDPATDLPALASAAKHIEGLALIIIDPIAVIVLGDSARNNEVRRALQPVVDMAAELKCAVLGITHMNKRSKGVTPLDRVNGSVAFGAVARMVWVCASDGNGSDARRVLVRAKTNLGPSGGGFSFALEERRVKHCGMLRAVVWGDALEGRAIDLLRDVEGTEADVELSGTQADRDDAEDFLRSLLAGGEIDNREVKAAAKAQGISDYALRRARETLKVTTRREGHGSAMRSYWRMADGEAP